nr:helix-turn-helix transcriptional regulator [Planctomycetota bacterium]
ALLRARLRMPHDAMHPGIRAVRDHISAVPEERTSAAALARRAGLAPSRFHQLFAQQVGHTPMRFQEECRMDRARRLLLSGELPVAAIAEACGYGDAFHFSARFHKVVGCSPSAYRIRPR